MSLPNCGHCGLSPRRDDPMRTLQLCTDGPATTAHVCTPCACALSGQPIPAPVRYPNGSNRPHRVCGICRLAPRWDDEAQQCIRLAPEDVQGTKVLPGLYPACKDCLALFVPRVYERRLREVAGTAEADRFPALESFGGNMLM